MKQIDPMLNVAEVAAMFNCSEPTVWRHSRTGVLPKPIKLGGMCRWLLSELEEVKAAKMAERIAA